MEIKNLIGKNAVYSGAFDIEWQSIEDKIVRRQLALPMATTRVAD